MSAFVTEVAVDLDKVRKALPPGSDVLACDFVQDAAGARVRFTWANDHLRGVSTHGNEFPLELLRARKLPAGVRDLKAEAAKVKTEDGGRKTEDGKTEA